MYLPSNDTTLKSLHNILFHDNAANVVFNVSYYY
nr:MAG TPA: hypothetical protein [Caudoviricetes sp.]